MGLGLLWELLSLWLVRMGVFLSAIAPVFIIALYIYFRDKYEKEPLLLLAKALAFGMLTVIPILFVERFLMGVMPPLGRVGAAAYQAFLVAGTTEEVFKFLALYLLIWKSPSFSRGTALTAARRIAPVLASWS